MVDALSTALLAYYLLSMPMKDLLNNWIQIFNEIIILICTWSLFLFTNYVPDPVLRYEFGQYFLYFIGFNLAVNILVFMWTILSSLIKWCRQKYGRNKQLKRVDIDQSSSSSESSSEEESSVELTPTQIALRKKGWDQRVKEFREQEAFEKRIKELTENGNDNDVY